MSTPEIRQDPPQLKTAQASLLAGEKITALAGNPHMLPDAAEILAEAFNATFAGIFFLEDDRNFAVLNAGSGHAGDAMLTLGLRLRVDQVLGMGKALTAQEADLSLTPQEKEPAWITPFLPGIQTSLTLPLSAGGVLLGVLTLQSSTYQAFTQEEVPYIQNTANQLALALENTYFAGEVNRLRTAVDRSAASMKLAGVTTQALEWIGQKNKAVGELAGTLKAAVAGGKSESEPLQKGLGQIEETAQLVQKVRDALVGPATGYQVRPAMLSDVVQAAAFFSEVPEEALTMNLEPDTPLVLADTSQLSRALGYLFTNALEAGSTRISANITPTLDGTHAAVSIADNGIGIPVENRQQIWQSFFTTKDNQHAGLGLPAALAIIARMGGQITFDSEAGQGAVFTVVLPSASDDEAVDLSHAPEHIFFVDEEEDAWALFAAKVLELAGKDIVVQGNPAGAANADLILIDEALTTMAVDDVLAELTEAGVVDRAVVVTAELHSDRIQKHQSAGAQHVALKPYTYTELARLFHLAANGRSAGDIEQVADDI
jgi:hypothetical protein